MKKNITRVLALLLALCMAFSLTSCKKSKKNNKKDNVSSSQTTSDPAPSDDIIADEPIEDEPVVDEPYDDGYIGDDDLGGNQQGATVDGGDSDSGDYSVVVDRPTTDGAISSGEKVDYTGGDIDDGDIDDDLDGDDFDDIDDEEEEISDEPFVQMYGEKVNGSTREINVDTSKNGELFDNILGTGCNFYPTWWAYKTQYEPSHGNYNFGYATEIAEKRYNDIHGPYGRSWFQIDWMVTNKAGDDYSKYDNDWTNNPDYKAYYNGEYSFDNDDMRSVIRYYKMLDRVDMDVEVSFGWKIADRLKAWFGADCTNPQNSAPRNIYQHADAAVALLKYCYYEAGIDNVNTLTYYNEPTRAETAAVQRRSGDYVTIGDKRLHWANMMKETVRLINNQPNEPYKKNGRGGDPDGFLKTVQIWGAENSERIDTFSTDYVTPYLNANYSDMFDAFTWHCYFSGKGVYAQAGNGDGYSALCQMIAQCTRTYNKPFYITETYSSDRDIIDDPSYAWDPADPTDDGWGSSYSAMFIACSNNGVRLNLDWSFCGGHLPDPLRFDPAGGDQSAWGTPLTKEKAGKVQYKYYLYAMRNQYIPRGASSQDIDWTGDDIRASAFKKGSDFALYVEANDYATTDRVLNVKLTESIGANKKLYVYVFDYNLVKDANATIPTYRDIVTVKNGRSFTYNITSRDYGVYLFSTVAPVKQAAVFDKTGENESVLNDVKLGETCELTAKLTDCAADDVIEWEVTSYADAIKKVSVDGKAVPQKQTERITRDKNDNFVKSGDVGTIVSTDGGKKVSYTPAADAKVGDVISIRGTIKSTKNNAEGKVRFTVAVFTIVADE